MSAPLLRATLAVFAAFASLVLAVVAPVAAQTAPSTFTSATRYDADHKITGTISPDPGSTGQYIALRNTYDAAGRLVRVEKGVLSAWKSELVAPADWGTAFVVQQYVDTTYDAVGHKVRDAVWGNDPLLGWTQSAATQYSYDLAGRLECTAQRMNPAIYAALPGSACALGTTGSQGPDRITRTVYDAAGQVLKVQKAYGVTTANGFPATLQQDYATYAYNLTGKKTRVIDANGNVASMSYDGQDRLVQWNFPDKVTVGAISASDYEAYGYDANGNRLTLRKRDGKVLTYTYDALNRVIQKRVPDPDAGPVATATANCNVSLHLASDSNDICLGYDVQGRQLYARFGHDGGPGLANGYDAFGRLNTASSDLDGVTRTLGYAYDADGNRIQVTHPDGTHFDYAYDGLDRPVAIQQNGATQVAAIAYDNQGRRSGDARGAVLSGYAYDGVSRLRTLSHDLAGTTADVSWGLGYNPASQIVAQTRNNNAYAFGYTAVSKTYAVNGLNQYTAADGAAPQYDLNGNLTSDGTTGYSYDAENRLIATSNGATLSYDPAGRLWQMTMGTSTVRFLYDGDQLLEERDGSGNLLRRYVHGNDEDDPLLWYEGSGLTDRRSFMVDHQGSIVSIGNADGTLRTIDSYDEYGLPGAANDGRFQYTGQAWLPALGLYYYKARIYSPKLGRFLQTDPIGYGDQTNLYAYVGNDPIDLRDSAGLAGGPGIGHNSASFGEMLEEIVEEAPEVIEGISSEAVAGPAIVLVGVLWATPAGGHGDGLPPPPGGWKPYPKPSVGPGPNAHDSVPAGPSPRPTAQQQRQIDQIGDKHGCHTCGARNSGTKSGKWVGDHQPPTKFNPRGGRQRYYPHCLRCSNIQGGLVRQMPTPRPPPPILSTKLLETPD